MSRWLGRVLCRVRLHRWVYPWAWTRQCPRCITWQEKDPPHHWKVARCSAGGIHRDHKPIDFKRDSAETIERVFTEAGKKKLKEAHIPGHRTYPAV